jgi:hypothetical protein
VRRAKSLKSPLSRASAIAALVLTLGIASTSAASSVGAGHRRVTGPAKAASHRAAAPSLIGGDSKTDCVYSANRIDVLHRFEQMVSKNIDCALVFNNASPNWAGWDDPWFLREQGSPASNWLAWATAPGTDRQLVITQGMFPSDVNGTNWLQAGAGGAYDRYARTLARKLVAAGLGNSVIRLGHEANDSGSPWFVGTTPESWRLWDQYWRQTVVAMRSVPGAHFLFDWCINAYWEPIALADWYPGNSFVNIIGVDAYDSGVPVGADRWSKIYTQPDGIDDVLRFAAAHGKPVSFPEWGLWTSGSAGGFGGGGDPAYIDGMAGVVKSNAIAYQSYFDSLASATLLADSPPSLAAYRESFGGGEQ